MNKIDLLNKIQQGMKNADIEAKNADTTGKKILAGLKLAGKAAGVEIMTLSGNVVDTTYKAGKVAVKAAVHAPKIINASVDRLDQQVDSLVDEGSVLGLDRAITVSSSTVSAYENTSEWVKGKFKKGEVKATEAVVVQNNKVEVARQAI